MIIQSALLPISPLIDLNLICVSQKLIFQSLWPYMPTAQAASVQLIVRQLAEVEQLCSLSKVPTQQTVSGLNKCNKMNISNLTMLCNIQRGLRNNLKTSPYTITDQFFKKKIGPEGGWGPPLGGVVSERGSGSMALCTRFSSFCLSRREEKHKHSELNQPLFLQISTEDQQRSLRDKCDKCNS